MVSCLAVHMYDRILKQMRELVRCRKYGMTVHAEDEMNADDLAIYDVESVVLTGQISERQRDQASAEWKYVIAGQSLDGEGIMVVAKLGPAGRLVFITVFRE
jgi:hypothetical protein